MDQIKCPRCGSKRVNINEVPVNGGWQITGVRCIECGKSGGCPEDWGGFELFEPEKGFLDDSGRGEK